MPKRLKVYRQRPLQWKLLLALIPLAILAGIGALWWHDSKPPSLERTVTLTFTGEDGVPLPGLEVAAVRTASDEVSAWGEQTARTDPQGRLTFTAPAGAYWLITQSAVFEWTLPQNPAAPAAQAFTVREDRYAVTLRLTDAQGRPAVGIPVAPAPGRLMNADAPALPGGVTDWQGAYVWRDAPAGAHTILLGGDGEGIPLILEPNERKNVQLSWTLPAAPSARYTRTVQIQRKNGLPDVGIHVSRTLYGVPSGKEFVLERFITDGEGRFTLESLPAGESALRLDGGARFKLSIPYADAPAQGEAVYRE